MNRLDRLHAILVQLQSKKIVRAQEIAERFNISLRTVYRDVHSLEQGGIPIIGEAGMGYSIMEGYRLPPVMFTREEATTFLMAEKVLEKYSDTYNAAVYKTAMFKIKAVLRSSEKDFLASIEDNIAVLNSAHKHHENNASLQNILTAITDKKVMVITYEGVYTEGVTKRFIEPIGIFLLNSSWYLIAFCRLRNDYRNFKVSRIQHQQITNQVFNTVHLSLEEYLRQTTREKQLEQVVLKVKKEVAKYIITEKFYHGFVSEKVIGDYIEMTFLSASLQGMARWILMFGDQVEIAQPAVLKLHVLSIIESIRENLK
jgi:predicted DNA-binding transcriptional regulator YafY